jgi:hypothetical protein
MRLRLQAAPPLPCGNIGFTDRLIFTTIGLGWRSGNVASGFPGVHLFAKGADMASSYPAKLSIDTDTVRASLEALLSKLKPAADDDANSNGTSGDDTLTGTEESDRISGRSGDDEIAGGEGADSLDGGSGDDLVLGQEGDDRLRGGSGDDSIDGGEGDDDIKAGSGDDEIAGGEGDDAISTGSGSDRVVFEGDFGDDVISDFRPGTDVIDLTAFGDITSVEQLTFTEEDGDTVITAEGLPGSITVKGATAAELKDGVSVEVACYLRGTMILTPQGERRIEDLSIGDKVITAQGASRPIRWIGSRSFATRFLKPGSRLLPVTIKAGALGEGADGAPIPRRDLRVSPGHSVLVDGVFVNADLLINGDTVLREEPAGDVCYMHVELDSPDALIADGAASETYVNDGNRRQFENWRSYVLLYGEDHSASRDTADRVWHRFAHAEPSALAAIRHRVNARADQRKAA